MSKKLLTMSLIVLCAVSSYAAEFCIYNPNEVTVKGIASIALDSLGIDKTEKLKITRTDSSKELPWQIISKDGKNLLLTALELKSMTTVRIKIEEGAGTAKALVKNEADDYTLTIDTPLYSIDLNKQKGYTINTLKDKKGGRIPNIHQAELIFFGSGEQETYNGHYARSQKEYYQSKSKVAGKTLYKGNLETQIELSWEFDAGSVRDTVTFNGVNRLVRHDVQLTYSKVMVQGEYRLSMPNFSTKKGEGTVYPQKERFPERTFAAPGYEFAFNPVKKCGIGVVAPIAQPLYNFFWQFTGKSEGRSFDRCKLSLFTDQLRYKKLPGTFDFSFALIAGGSPSEAADYAIAANNFREFKAFPVNVDQGIVNSITFKSLSLIGQKNIAVIELSPKCDANSVKVKIDNIAVASTKTERADCLNLEWQPKKEGINKIEISNGKNSFLYDVNVKKIASVNNIRIDKIVNKPNKSAGTTATVTNHSASPETFKLVSSVISDTDKTEIVNTQNANLAAFETKAIKIPWKTGAEKKGITFNIKIYHNDKLTDSASEYGAVTAFVPDAGQYSVANPGWFKTPGQEKLYIKNLRNNYFGFFEYYCWTPCPMMGLCPKDDVWDAQTESQVAYSAKISKKFVKNFVKVAHESGISVFPWMNGEIALPTGLDNPEYYRYGKTGQPLLYNGTIRKGKRYAIAYTSALYDPEVAYKWGQDMAKSIDMFGWDGCRFDWAFTPSVVGDPMRAKKSDWYNQSGVPSRKLFPDQDGAGTKALQAFRKGVAETHPEFIYGTNSGEFSPEIARTLPKYKVESSTNSWIWFEYLLGYNSKRCSTWQKWSKLLTEDSQIARPNGSQIGLGWMHLYPSGAVSGKLMPYIILYSGLHWIGVTDRNNSLGENWKIWRYAMRFSKYFYNSKFLLMPEKERLEAISVTGSPHLFWKQWIFEKKAKNGRSLLVNMVNLPEGDYVSERHLPPKPQKNIVLTFNKQNDEKVKKVVMLNALPEPHSVKLQAKTDGNKVTVTIPEVKWGTGILIETQK
jgi:hypothetical protein